MSSGITAGADAGAGAGGEPPAGVRERVRRASGNRSGWSAALAVLLARVRRRGYFRAWGFPTFRAYVEGEVGLRLRTAQSLVATARRLRRAGVRRAALRGLAWSKLELAARYVTADNRAAVLAAVRASTLRELRVCLRREHGRAAAPGAATAAVAGPPPPPDPAEFYVDPGVWEQLGFALRSGTPLLLTGPAGCGKSELVYRAARAAGRPVAAFNLGATTEPRTALIGTTHFARDRGTWFEESRFVRAVRTPGTVVLLDELSRAGADAFNILLPLLDDQGYLALDEGEGGAVVTRAAGVTFFATANVGAEYTGAAVLDRALADRFPAVVPLDFPPREAEARVLVRRCPGLDPAAAARLVDVAARQREMAREGEFVGEVSTRALLGAGAQIAAGVSPLNALTYCVLSRFSADGGAEAGERAKLRKICMKVYP